MTGRTYKIGEWGAVRKDFSETFGVTIGPFYDGMMTVFSKKICIDPFKFDDFLHRKFGDYEDRGLSMYELVYAEFGEQAALLLEALT